MSANENPDITTDLFGDEAAIEEQERGWLPNRNQNAVEAAAAEAATPAPTEADPIAELAAHQSKTLETLGLDDEPDDWVADPSNLEEVRANNAILDNLLGVGEITERERQKLVDSAMYHLRDEFVPGADLARQLREIDPKAHDDFVKAWAAEEAEDDLEGMTALDYLNKTRELDRMLTSAKQIVADQEEAEEPRSSSTTVSPGFAAAYPEPTRLWSSERLRSSLPPSPVPSLPGKRFRANRLQASCSTRSE